MTLLIPSNKEINSFFIRPFGIHLIMVHIPLILNFVKAQKLGKNMWVVLDKSLNE